MSAFDADALAKAARNTPLVVPREEAHVGVTAQNGEVGVEGTVSKSLGKGAFVQGEGSWFTRTGYRVAAMIGWTPKS